MICRAKSGIFAKILIMTSYFVKSLFLSLLFLNISLRSDAQVQPDTVQKIEPGRLNSKKQIKKPYVILISADGFRNDYAKKYHAQFLSRMKKEGLSTRFMLPSYPSLTFPNHYTLITGLYPSHHGLVGNAFDDLQRGERYDKRAAGDSSWYGGTPLWVLAEKQQMLSASFFWVGSEAAIQGYRPSYWYKYNEAIPINERIDIVINWLKLPEDKRPHFITFYLPEVDHAGHNFGPDSEETEASVKFVDQAIALLNDKVSALGLPVNFVFVSDHGMVEVQKKNLIRLASLPADTSSYTITGGGTLAGLFLKPGADTLAVYRKFKSLAKGFKVYTKHTTPRSWHFRPGDDRYQRIPDILLEPREIRYFSASQPKPGQHGYDPRKVPAMYASFIAWGPAFRKGKVIRPFENVNIYPLVAHLLDLPADQPVDGRLQPFLKGLKSGGAD